MKFLTTPELDQIPGYCGPRFERSTTESVARGTLGQIEACRAMVVAKTVADWLFEHPHLDDQLLAHVYETGIWPSCENRHLYYVWRRSQADHRLIEDAPGHLFHIHEHWELISFLHMCILFGWGVNCTSRMGSRAFDIDHDTHYAILVINDPIGQADFASRLA